MSIKRAYYRGNSGQDVIDVILDFDLGWIEGDILKRLVRMGKKDGQTEVDDWQKIVEEAVRGLEQAQSRSPSIVGEEDGAAEAENLPTAHFGYALKRGQAND